KLKERCPASEQGDVAVAQLQESPSMFQSAPRPSRFWLVTLALFIPTAVTVPILSRSRHRPSPATLPELLVAVQAKHPEWRIVRIRDNSPDVYLFVPDYRQDKFFPPIRAASHMPRWHGLVHVQRALRWAPVNEPASENFLILGDVELFGDAEMLREIAK